MSKPVFQDYDIFSDTSGPQSPKMSKGKKPLHLPLSSVYTYRKCDHTVGERPQPLELQEPHSSYADYASTLGP